MQVRCRWSYERYRIASGLGFWKRLTLTPFTVDTGKTDYSFLPSISTAKRAEAMLVTMILDAVEVSSVIDVIHVELREPLSCPS